MSQTAASRNIRLAAICGVLFFAMVGAAFAAVPLYQLFCQVTGFDGTVRRADQASSQILDRTLNVRFDANVRDMPWTFTAEENSQVARIGETKMAYFKVVNSSDKPITGHATYNVVPESAGAHFRKLECFCFREQTLQPGETMEFPVVYFIDPEFATDKDTRGKTEVTLSYTFFRVDDAKAEVAAKG